MPEGSIPLLIAIILLVFSSAFFSATETAFSCASKIKLRTLSSAGNKKAEKVLKLSESNYDKLITTILVGNNIVNLTSATLATIFFNKIMHGSSNASLVSTIVITITVLIVGEIIPKFMAKINAEKNAIRVFPIIMVFYYIFYLFNFLFSGLRYVISKIFRITDEEIITEEEILTVVEEAEEDGTIKEEESKLIRSVIEFDDLEVGDILVPRVNIVAVEENATLDQIKDVFMAEGYSRIPVYKGGIDQIIGTIHEKDFFNAYIQGNSDISTITQKAYYTTEHIKISALLKQLQKMKIHLAVVLDEYGGTLGIVTLEDILEELVGEIWDEHDEEINYIKNIGDNLFLIDGNMPLDEFFEALELSGDEEKYGASTVSGWVIEYLGNIPHSGNKFDYANLAIEITKSTVRRVLQIKVRLLTKE